MNAADVAPFAIAAPAVGLWAYLRWKAPGSSTAPFARPGDLALFTPRGVRKSARRLRRDLPRRPELDECGIMLGRLRPNGTEILATLEDTVLAIMGPRAGHKTSGLAIPTVLDAPGPVIATANKADLWCATATTREDIRASASGESDRRTRRPDAHADTHLVSSPRLAWAFDPQGVAHIEQFWWWDPLRHVTNIEAARRFASMFVRTVEGDGKEKFWSESARQLLTALFLAAHHGRHGVDIVWTWLTEQTSPEPGDILRRHREHRTAELLDGIQGDAVETRSGIYATARAAAVCLSNDRITRWVTPGHAVDEFDPDAFVRSHDALHMLSKDGAGGAAPLVAALTDRVFTAAVERAERSRGLRLDPPLVAVLDEAANICPIHDLPALYSHFSSRGIVPITILQSYDQAVRVWGHNGAKALFSTSTAILIGAGNNDASFLNDVSRLLDEHDVPTTSVGRSAGRSNYTRSVRHDRVMSAGRLRKLARGDALLLVPGSKPALIRLVPWYKTRRRDSIAAAIAAAEHGIAERSAA